jgi:hypothetical protein
MVESFLEKLCREGVLSTEQSGSMVKYGLSYEQKRDRADSTGTVGA